MLSYNLRFINLKELVFNESSKSIDKLNYAEDTEARE